jgi:hypothetical protein
MATNSALEARLRMKYSKIIKKYYSPIEVIKSYQIKLNIFTLRPLKSLWTMF